MFWSKLKRNVKEAQTFVYICNFQKKKSRVQNRLIGGNSPNLVTLISNSLCKYGSKLKFATSPIKKRPQDLVERYSNEAARVDKRWEESGGVTQFNENCLSGAIQLKLTLWHNSIKTYFVAQFNGD
jgi:hypothetical protein